MTTKELWTKIIEWKTVIIWSLSLIFSIPLLTNLLLIFSVSDTISDNSGNAWVGYLGTYIGAIIGGLVSGSLTLIGVVKSISHTNQLRGEQKQMEIRKERLERMDTLPLKLLSIDEMINEFNRYLHEYKKIEFPNTNPSLSIEYRTTQYKHMRADKIRSVKQDLIKKGIVEKSAKSLDIIVYRTISQFYYKIDDFVYDNFKEKGPEQYEWLNPSSVNETTINLDDFDSFIEGALDTLKNTKNKYEKYIIEHLQLVFNK